MKLATAILLISASLLFKCAYGQPTTPAEQRIAAARQQVASDPKKSEAYNDLALALISRAQETESADYDRQAADAIATGLGLAPQDFQLRKTQVVCCSNSMRCTSGRRGEGAEPQNPDDGRWWIPGAGVHGLGN